MTKTLNIREMPSHWPRYMREEKCPTLQHSPEHIPMIASSQPNKPSKVRGLLTVERRKRLQGWPQCFCKTPPKPTLCNSNMDIDPLEKHLYEEPEDVENKDNNSNLHGIEEEEDMNENYEPLENKETTVYYVHICK